MSWRFTVKMKPSATTRADQVAGDHDPLAVHAVEQHAGDGTGEHGGNRAASMTPLTTRPELRIGQRQAEYGDVVEVIADLADHLADPGVAIVVIGPQQLLEGTISRAP